jgi:hypothetical protein
VSGPLEGISGRLEARAEELCSVLEIWARRDDSKAQPEVRQAANDAVDAIDGMLRALHEARAALVAEIRQSDDATAARVDAMLARRRDGAS